MLMFSLSMPAARYSGNSFASLNALVVRATLSICGWARQMAMISAKSRRSVGSPPVKRIFRVPLRAKV